MAEIPERKRADKREYDKQYYVKHRIERLLSIKAWRQCHREEFLNYGRAYRQNPLNQVKRTHYQKTYNQKLKEQVIFVYSNGTMECARCGFANILALSIDHINSGGNRHKDKILKRSGLDFYQWLRSNNFPREGYQVLCMNCQFIKREEKREYGNI